MKEIKTLTFGDWTATLHTSSTLGVKLKRKFDDDVYWLDGKCWRKLQQCTTEEGIELIEQQLSWLFN